jgi:hypothetical protein
MGISGDGPFLGTGSAVVGRRVSALFPFDFWRFLVRRDSVLL